MYLNLSHTNSLQSIFCDSIFFHRIHIIFPLIILHLLIIYLLYFFLFCLYLITKLFNRDNSFQFFFHLFCGPLLCLSYLEAVQMDLDHWIIMNGGDYKQQTTTCSHSWCCRQEPRKNSWRHPSPPVGHSKPSRHLPYIN